MSFNNKVVLITGASSGIGAAIALKFSKEGANVVIVDIQKDKLKIVAENIKKIGKKPLVIIADLTKENDVQRIVNETIEHFRKIDVLVNNAAVGGFLDITDENAMQVFDNIMATNLRSVVYLTHLTSKHLIKTKGNIVNISSVGGQMVLKNSFAYLMSKAALDHFSRLIALDFASKGVCVNSISPGPVKTDFFKNLEYSSEMAAAAWENLREMTALKRLSEASEIAELALFMANDKAVGITGSTYVTDNGFMLGGH